MPKIQTTCPVCSGSYDGTPSGLAKHTGTGKHALAARLAAKVTTPKAVVSKPVNTTGADFDTALDAPKEDPSMVAAVANSVSRLIESKEQELARRQIDHRYRQRHASADAAEAYRVERVAPLQSELLTLLAVHKVLRDGR